MSKALSQNTQNQETNKNSKVLITAIKFKNKETSSQRAFYCIPIRKKYKIFLRLNKVH